MESWLIKVPPSLLNYRSFGGMLGREWGAESGEQGFVSGELEFIIFLKSKNEKV